jgi:hypothetical protein
MSNRNANMAGVKNSMKNATSYLKGSNKIVLALVGIFIFFVVGMIVYWIYKAIQKSHQGNDMNPILVDGVIDASDPSNSKHWSLPITSSPNSPNLAFSLSFWIYVADWNYRFNSPKAIVVKGANGYGTEDAAPGIWLARVTNRLVVATRTKGYDTNLEYCDVENIPLQKWVHITYILDNRVADIYINGKLERSCVLKAVPYLNSQDLFLFPPNDPSVETGGITDNQTGFWGQLSSLRYFSKALRPVDVARLYNEGPHSTTGSGSKDAKGHHKGKDGGKTKCPTKPEQIVINL